MLLHFNLAGTKAHARRHNQNHENLWGIEPNTLTEDQFDERWREVTVTFVKEEVESRCEQKCKKPRYLVLKFSLLVMHAKLTLSRKRKWSRNSIDYESSDAVKLKQLINQMV